MSAEAETLTLKSSGLLRFLSSIGIFKQVKNDQSTISSSNEGSEDIYQYDQDGLKTVHNADFMTDQRFMSAYQRGVQAAGSSDYNWHWRVHIGLWAGRTAIRVPGDFVECGVNFGFLSSAIMHDLDWNSSNRNFYLLDTFKGIDPEHVSENERADGILDKNQWLIDNKFYTTQIDTVRQNFSQWPSAIIVEGTVPETLQMIKSDRIAFIHIDMNCAPPEVAALEYLWPKMSQGGVVLLDDYAYTGYHHQKNAMDDLALKLDFDIACLPTGQGLIIKT